MKVRPDEYVTGFKMNCMKKHHLIDFSKARIRKANSSTAYIQKEATQRG